MVIKMKASSVEEVETLLSAIEVKNLNIGDLVEIEFPDGTCERYEFVLHIDTPLKTYNIIP